MILVTRNKVDHEAILANIDCHPGIVFFGLLDILSGLFGAVDGSECGLNLMAERAPS